MKTYIVHIDGVEKCMIKASGHNAAEKRAKRLYPNAQHVSVSYAGGWHPAARCAHRSSARHWA